MRARLLSLLSTLSFACASPTDTESFDSRGPLGKADQAGSCLADDGGDFCGTRSSASCWCDDACDGFGDCCADVGSVCRGEGPDLPESNVWSRSIASTGSAGVSDLDLATSGDIAVTGGFYGVASFGANIESANGERDVYVTRIGPDGTFSWSTRVGTPGHDIGLRVAAHGDTTVVLGMLGANANWEEQTFYAQDHFLAAFDGTGELLWKTRLGRWRQGYQGSLRDLDLDVFADGGIVVVGGFSGWVDLGDGANLVAAASPKGFFAARYAADGVFEGASVFRSLSASVLTHPVTRARVVVDADDRYTLVATVRGSRFDLGAGELPSSGLDDVLLARFSRTGELAWAHRVGGAGVDVATDVGLDGAGNVLITGYWEGQLGAGESCTSHRPFRTDLGGPDLVNSYCGARAFAAAYDGASGTHRWSTTIAGRNGHDYHGAEVVSDGDDTLVLGSFNGRIDFGAGPIDNSHGLGAARHDLFLARLSATGQLVTGEVFPGFFAEDPIAHRNLEITASGNPILGGTFTFDLATPGGMLSSTPGGGTDGFVAQW